MSDAAAKPLFLMPSPDHLRAGAIWVEVKNWTRACVRRYGGATVATADGLMDDLAVAAAASRHGGAVSNANPSRARILAETFVKDLRWIQRGRSQHGALAALDLGPISPFVWQHHDLFQQAGATIARAGDAPLVQFVDAPCVWEAARWGTTRPGWGRLVERFGERPQLQAADVVCCVTEEVGNEVLRFGVDPDRVLVTPCTADEADYVDRTGRRTELGLDDATVVGWVGSFRRFHNLDVMVEAVAKARSEDPSLHLLMVGDGPDRERIVALARDLGVPCTAPGAVAHDEVPDYIVSFDIAVVPAGAGQAFHYSPLKLKEYLAAGRATVAPALGEMARVLTHGSDALLYSPGDVDALAGALATLSTDAEHRNAVALAGQATARARFRIDDQLEQIEKML